MKFIPTFLLVPILIFASHYSSIFTHSIIRELKLGTYVTPILGWKFDHWLPFIAYSMAAFQVVYCINGIVLLVAYKLSYDHFGTMYPAVILNLVAALVWTVTMMYLRVGEIPTREGWIALVLIILAALLAMNAGKNIAPH